MSLNEAIKELKDENEQCCEQCEGCCSEVKNNICTCRDAIVLSALEKYQDARTVQSCLMTSEQVKELREYAEHLDWVGAEQVMKAYKLMTQAANTIEELSAKLQEANMSHHSQP